MYKKMWLAWVAVLAVVALLSGCGGSGATEETSSAQGPAIVIEDFGFGEPLTVAPGTEIQIANNDSAEHSVTSDSEGAFDVHVDGGETATLTAPTEPGEYTYHCVYHPNMKGTLVVQ